MVAWQATNIIQEEFDTFSHMADQSISPAKIR